MAAERAVLSSLYRCGFAAYADVSDVLDVDSFTVEENQLWYKCLVTYYERDENREKTPDIPTVVSVATELGLASQASQKKAQDLLRAYSNYPAELANARSNALKLQRLYYTRLYRAELAAALTELDGVTGAEPMSEVLAIGENRILSFADRVSGGSDGPKKLGDGLSQYMEGLLVAGKPAGISTGFPHYDAAIGGGLCPNSVDLIVARSKTGKSVVATNVGRNISRLGIPVLHVDTEMSREEQMRRLVASTSRVKERAIKDGVFRDCPSDVAKVRQAATDLASVPFYHEYVGGMSPEEILGVIRRWMVKTVGLDENGYVKPSVVLYDYIKLPGAGGSGEWKEYQSLGFITIGLKNLMGKYNGRCLAFGQQNREGLDFDDERSIAGSDRLVWFSTSTTIFKWQSPEEQAAQNGEDGPEFTHKLIPVLSRHGGRWPYGDFIHVKSDLETCYLEEGPRAHDHARKTKF